MFSGHFQLSRVPQEVGEVIVQFSVMRKRLQTGSGNQNRQLYSIVQQFADFTLIIFYFISRVFNKSRSHAASIARLSIKIGWKALKKQG
jgi:hypothetical protein